jgi:hypothetical protein
VRPSVFGDRVLKSYARYYNESRIHRSLSKDALFPRAMSGLASSPRNLSSAVFIIVIAESDFGTLRQHDSCSFDHLVGATTIGPIVLNFVY